MVLINWDLLRVVEPEFYKKMSEHLKTFDWYSTPSLAKSDIFKTTFLTHNRIIFKSLGVKIVFKSWCDFEDYIYKKYGVVV